jgi:flagellar secretion chaperone FliS
MNPYTNEYIAQEVQCADPGRLVELLFDRAVRDLRNACELWPSLNTSPAAIHLVVHAQCILIELQRSLNFAEGGELAVNLARLYQFMQGELASATEKRDEEAVQKIQNVIELLASLGDAWSGMLRQQQQTPAGSSGVHSGANLVA